MFTISSRIYKKGLTRAHTLSVSLPCRHCTIGSMDVDESRDTYAILGLYNLVNIRSNAALLSASKNDPHCRHVSLSLLSHLLVLLPKCDGFPWLLSPGETNTIQHGCQIAIQSCNDCGCAEEVLKSILPSLSASRGNAIGRGTKCATQSPRMA